MKGYLEPKKDPKRYLAGFNSTIPTKIIHEDMDWSKYTPKFESQIKNFETWNCTSFSTLNAIETILQSYGIYENYSDRWVGIIAGTDPEKGGNDPVTVIEAIRKYGLIPESMLPMSDDLQNVEEYYSFKGADMQECYAKGREWLETWKVGYDEIPITPDAIKNYLKCSPLGLSVAAWYKNDEGKFYSPEDVRPNHWTLCVKPEWLIVDSYLTDNTPIKNLTPDFKFGFILRYYIELQERTKKKLSLMEILVNLISKYIWEIAR